MVNKNLSKKSEKKIIIDNQKKDKKKLKVKFNQINCERGIIR
jgi:hypothetical protein